MAGRFILSLVLLGFLSPTAHALDCKRDLKMLGAYAKHVDFEGAYFYIRSRVHQWKEKYLGVLPAIKRKYSSENGQDRWLDENVFRGKLNGTFVDIGAYDGVHMSNSYFFEHVLGWKGVAVEPHPAAFQSLVKSRNCITLQGCVSASTLPQHFTVIERTDDAGHNPSMHSGITAHYDPRHVDKIDHLLKDPRFQRKEIEVPSISFEKIMEELGQHHIDYLSIDTEGAEFEILQTIPFDKVNISVIGVENNYADPRIHRFLVKNGYHRVKRIGQDDFYFLNGFAGKPSASPKESTYEAPKAYPQNALPAAHKVMR